MFIPYEARPDIKKKYIENPTFIKTNASVQAYKVTSTAYTALKDHRHSYQFFNLKDLVGETSKFCFKLHKWDGQLSIC